jgi:hypothetical protein
MGSLVVFDACEAATKTRQWVQASEFEEPPFSVLVATDGAALTHLREVLEADRRPPVQRDERVAGLLPDVRLVTSDARL